MRPRFVAASAALVALLSAVPAAAQDVTEYNTPAHLSVADGQVTLEREGRLETAPSGMPLSDGDRLRTESGRAEVMYPDASVLHLDQFTTVDISDGSLLRLLEGRAFLAVSSSANESYRIDTPLGSVDTEGPGEYRVSLLNSPTGLELELAVSRGTARLTNDTGEAFARSGERVVASANRGLSAPMAFNSAAFDAFDRWSNDRRGLRTSSVSTQYLPVEMRGYAGTFDRYGSWTADPTYGYVWYPQVVVGWRPFYNGFWYHGRRWGLTWIGGDAWNWPTHHFGHWGLSSVGRWYWRPSRGWHPGRVHWASTPGYYGWSPVGFDGGPIINVNVFSSYRGHGPDPWRAWTVVSAHNFGVNTWVSRHTVDRRAFGTRGGAFVASTHAPFGVGRGPVGPALGSPVRRALPRVSAAAWRGSVVSNVGPSGMPSLQRRAIPRTAIASPQGPGYGPYNPAVARPSGQAPPDNPYDRARRVTDAPRRPAGSGTPRTQPAPRNDPASKPADPPAASGNRSAPASRGTGGTNRRSYQGGVGVSQPTQSPSGRVRAVPAPRYQSPTSQSPTYQSPRSQSPRSQSPAYQSPASPSRFAAPRVAPSAPSAPSPRYYAPDPVRSNGMSRPVAPQAPSSPYARPSTRPSQPVAPRMMPSAPRPKAPQPVAPRMGVARPSAPAASASPSRGGSSGSSRSASGSSNSSGSSGRSGGSRRR